MLRGRNYALVAGGAGFIGSHLVEELIAFGWVVDVIDDFSTGDVESLRPAMEKANIARDGGGLSLKIMSQDIVRLSQDPCCEEGASYDVVFNLACPASPRAYQSDPVATMLTNVLGTTNMLALAQAHSARLVQASTSEVYGDPLEHPQRESYWGHVNPWGPRACYDEGKRAAETLCHDFRARGVDARVARVFNTYGPRMRPDDGRVVSTFVRQAILGEPLTVFGDGSQTRSFSYVTDTTRALRALAEAPVWDHGPVNVGNDGEFKVIELVEALSEWFPRVLSVEAPLPKDDPRTRQPDLTLARRELGYEPRVPLREGLKLTVEWMRDRLSRKDG